MNTDEPRLEDYTDNAGRQPRLPADPQHSGYVMTTDDIAEIITSYRPGECMAADEVVNRVIAVSTRFGFNSLDIRTLKVDILEALLTSILIQKSENNYIAKNSSQSSNNLEDLEDHEKFVGEFTDITAERLAEFQYYLEMLAVLNFMEWVREEPVESSRQRLKNLIFIADRSISEVTRDSRKMLMNAKDQMERALAAIWP